MRNLLFRKIASLYGAIRIRMNAPRPCCGRCCYAAEPIALEPGENRFFSHAEKGETNKLVCMIGCSSRQKTPTIVRKWQPICPAYLPWRVYDELHDPSDDTWNALDTYAIGYLPEHATPAEG